MSNLTAITLCVLAFLLAVVALMGLAGVLVGARRTARMLVVVPAAQDDPMATHAPASASRASGSSTVRTRDLQE